MTRLCGAEVGCWASGYEAEAFWDDAVRGSLALRVALTRLFLDETADLLGVAHADLAWDIDSFYDSVLPARALGAALDLGYPPQLLGVCAVAWTGPRLLRSGGEYSVAVQPQRSILAGDGSSGNVAKCLLFGLLQGLHAGFMPRGVASRTWVDDVVQRAEGTAAGVAVALAEAGSAFASGVRELGLTVASKSCMVGSSSQLLEDVQARIKEAGGPALTAERCFADLGTERGPERHRRPLRRAKRTALAMRSMRRLRRLPKTRAGRRVARRVALAGAMARWRYGVQGVGSSPSELQAVRRALGALLPGRAAGRCLTTALALEFGQHDPAVDLPMGVVRHWFDVVAPYELLRRRARRSWEAARSRVLAAPAAARWRRVRGMVSGVIYVVDLAGWRAEGPFRWISDEGVPYELPEES